MILAILYVRNTSCVQVKGKFWLISDQKIYVCISGVLYYTVSVNYLINTLESASMWLWWCWWR